MREKNKKEKDMQFVTPTYVPSVPVPVAEKASPILGLGILFFFGLLVVIFLAALRTPSTSPVMPEVPIGTFSEPMESVPGYAYPYPIGYPYPVYTGSSFFPFHPFRPFPHPHPIPHPMPHPIR